MAYDKEQIVKELTQTALGEAYHGNALRVAKDIPCLTQKERWTLDRWANGYNTVSDGWELQYIAMKISADWEE